MANNVTSIRPNGVILYEGPSKLDGAPIVVIATGLQNKSRNEKTGAMVQTYILRADMSPADAVRIGADVSICGDCVHRGDGAGKGRSCYVTLAHGPRSVFDGYKRGIYPKANAFQARELLAGRLVRLGTYGDPAAAPFALWSVALKDAAAWTGYTHQWRHVAPEWAALVMASADDEAGAIDARAMGYRTFRVTAEPFQNTKGETTCPASEEKNYSTDCATCKACMGTTGKARASITIAAHGTGKSHAIKRAA